VMTANAAWVLGLDSITGTLEPGKMADVVLWSADPFSVYAKALQSITTAGWSTTATIRRTSRGPTSSWGKSPLPGVIDDRVPAGSDHRDHGRHGVPRVGSEDRARHGPDP